MTSPRERYRQTRRNIQQDFAREFQAMFELTHGARAHHGLPGLSPDEVSNISIILERALEKTMVKDALVVLRGGQSARFGTREEAFAGIVSVVEREAKRFVGNTDVYLQQFLLQWPDLRTEITALAFRARLELQMATARFLAENQEFAFAAHQFRREVRNLIRESHALVSIAGVDLRAVIDDLAKALQALSPARLTRALQQRGAGIAEAEALIRSLESLITNLQQRVGRVQARPVIDQARKLTIEMANTARTAPRRAAQRYGVDQAFREAQTLLRGISPLSPTQVRFEIHRTGIVPRIRAFDHARWMEGLDRQLDLLGPVRWMEMVGRGYTLERAFQVMTVGIAGRVSWQLFSAANRRLLRRSQRDTQVKGYVRVTEDDPCAFCAMLSSRGPVYKSESTAEGSRFSQADLDFKVHDHCACFPEPFYVDQIERAEWPERSSEFRTLWDRTTPGSVDPQADASKASLNAFRRAFREYEGRDV